MERTKNRKLEQLAKKTYALSERHSRLSERSESFSQLSYERSEGARAEVRKKAKRTEELKERLRRENKRKGSELNARNLERFNKAKVAREHVVTNYQAFQQNIKHKHYAQSQRVSQTRQILFQNERQKKELQRIR